MYEVFDLFITNDTWHTHHPSDTELFLQLLYKVAWDNKFNTEAMGEHLREKLNLSDDDRNDYFSETIDSYVCDAWAV